MASISRELVQKLQACRNRYGRGSTDEKLHLLAQCVERSLTNPRTLLLYHETLMFLAAYPDTRRLHAAVTAELTRVGEAAANLARTKAAAKALTNTGLPGTIVEMRRSIDLVQWLADRFPRDVDIAWRNGSAGELLDDVLSAFVPPIERDSLQCLRLKTEQWTRLAAGKNDASSDALAWIIRTLRRHVNDEETLDHAFDALELLIRWNLGPVSRTTLRFPVGRVACRTAGWPRSFTPARVIGRALPRPEPLRERDRHGLIDVARATLAIRDRETDPVTHANPRDIVRFDLEHGVNVVLLGTLPGRRLPIESYVGYVAACNGVPVAYGGAWILNHRAEIGIHLFETFRGGASAYLFAHVLRTYRDYFDVHRFQIAPYQFGEDNPDAIKSGEFWFYYRLGFRPLDAKLRQLADDEWSTLRQDRKHRTPATTLRRFTKSPMSLVVSAAATAEAEPPPLSDLGVAVMRMVGRDFDGDRDHATAWAQRRVNRILRPRRSATWPADEQASFRCLAPLIAILPGLETWSARDRRTLVAVMRVKGGVRERDYVRAVQKHPRLIAALRTLAGRPPV